MPSAHQTYTRFKHVRKILYGWGRSTRLSKRVRKEMRTLNEEVLAAMTKLTSKCSIGERQEAITRADHAIDEAGRALGVDIAPREPTPPVKLGYEGPAYMRRKKHRARGK